MLGLEGVLPKGFWREIRAYFSPVLFWDRDFSPVNTNELKSSTPVVSCVSSKNLLINQIDVEHSSINQATTILLLLGCSGKACFAYRPEDSEQCQVNLTTTNKHIIHFGVRIEVSSFDKIKVSNLAHYKKP